VVPEEVRARAPPVEHIAGDRVEIGGRCPGLRCPRTLLVHLGNDATRLAHVGNLRGRLTENHYADCSCSRSAVTLTSRSNTSSPSPTPSTRTKKPPCPVVVDDRHGLVLVELEPALDGFFGVVVALADVAAARVAHPRVRRRHVHVVGALAVLAHAPARNAVEHDLARTSRSITRSSGHDPSTRSSSFACGTVRGNPSEHEPVAERAARHHALFDDADDDLVGHQLTRIHEALRLEPERGALHRLGAEHVAGRDARRLIVLGKPRRLRSLAGALLPQQHEPRLGGQVRTGILRSYAS